MAVAPIPTAAITTVSAAVITAIKGSLDMRMSIFAAVLVIAAPAFAWDGVDSETGASVEIEKGNLVRTGRDIEVYDHDTGEYRDVTVEDINRYGSAVEVEVYDNDTGEYRTFEMEDD